MEDSFSMDGVGGNGSGSNTSNGEQQMKFRWLTHHSPPAVLPPIPNRPQTGTDPQPGGWGPLVSGTSWWSSG